MNWGLLGLGESWTRNCGKGQRGSQERVGWGGGDTGLHGWCFSLGRQMEIQVEGVGVLAPANRCRGLG